MAETETTKADPKAKPATAQQQTKPPPTTEPPTDPPPEQAAEEPPLERQTGQDFEVGSTEVPYLSSGVTADAAFAQRDENTEKLRVEQLTQAGADPAAVAYPTTQSSGGAVALQEDADQTGEAKDGDG